MEDYKTYLESLPVVRNTVEFMFTSDYGLITDPVYKLGGEKCTLQIPTYEAIKGILMSVYWKPTIIWYIDAVRVMNRITTEVKSMRPIKMSGGNDLAYYTYLKNCCYQVRAHFEFNCNRPELEADRDENKHHNIARRMIKKGGRRDTFLGTRECQGYVEPCVFGEGEGAYDDISRLDFGNMYHGITYADEYYNEETRGKLTVRYWKAYMKYGIIAYPKPWECEYTRAVRKMDVKLFDEGHENFTGLKEFEKEGGYGTT